MDQYYELMDEVMESLVDLWVVILLSNPSVYKRCKSVVSLDTVGKAICLSLNIYLLQYFRSIATFQFFITFLHLC